MKTLSQRLNLTCGWEKSDKANVISFDHRRDVNIYETFTLYCHDKDIDLANVSDDEFNNCVETIQDYANGCNGDQGNFVNFWLD